MASPLGSFKRFWKSWDSALDPIVKRNMARLFFPDLKEETSKEITTFTPVDPILIWSAKEKAASKRSTHRIAILLGGAFSFNSKTGEMIHAKCNITFYKMRNDADQYTLTLIDAIHFDIESPTEHSFFHPAFHAQRGASLGSDGVIAVVEKHLHHKVAIDEVGAHKLPNGAFRLPTPQLDMFSVLTVVVADYFCNGGEVAENPNIKEQFVGILSLLRGSSNIARDGRMGRWLHSRLKEDICTGRWYSECA